MDIKELLNKPYNELTYIEFSEVRKYKKLNNLNFADMSGPNGYIWTGKTPLFKPCLSCGAVDVCSCIENKR